MKLENHNFKRALRNKMVIDVIARIAIIIFAFTCIALFLLLFFMILKESFPAYHSFGFFHMYFTTDFSQKGGWGIWGALLVTLVTSIIAVLIAVPIALRTAIFIKYRIVKGKRAIKMVINILAGIPSVVFGLFAINSLSSINAIFSISNATSIFTSILVLIIMVFPILVSLIGNQLELVPNHLIESSLALGNTKTNSIYKVVKKAIKQGVFIAAIVALGRTIGETMALSMILTTAPSSSPMTLGFSNFFNSSSGTLGVMIARLMFTDSSNEEVRSALFAAGIALFITIMILISIVNSISKQRIIRRTNPWKNNYAGKNSENSIIHYLGFGWFCFTLPFKTISFAFSILSERIGLAANYVGQIVTYPLNKLIFPKRNATLREYYVQTARYPLRKTTDIARILAEILSFLVIMLSVSWIILDIVYHGFPNWKKQYWSWSYYQWSNYGLVERPGIIANTLVFTIVLLLLSIVLAIPFAIATALFLSEYARNKRSSKVIQFFLDALGGTPSIIFALFGVVFFRQLLGIANGGVSLIAGSLTMTIVIIPTFSRSVEQVLARVPYDLREASYALGASKFETIRKVILPQAFSGIITGIILSAGRVIAETAPVYLTIGMMGNTQMAIDGEGWTMTTKIFYNQIFSAGNISEMTNQSYAIASVALLLIAAIISIAEVTPWLVKNISLKKTIIKAVHYDYRKWWKKLKRKGNYV